MNLPVVVGFDGGEGRSPTPYARGRTAGQQPGGGEAATSTHPRPHVRTSNPGTNLDIVEVWGRDSFPASDPPANW